MLVTEMLSHFMNRSNRQGKSANHRSRYTQCHNYADLTVSPLLQSFSFQNKHYIACGTSGAKDNYKIEVFVNSSSQVTLRKLIFFFNLKSIVNSLRQRIK